MKKLLLLLAVPFSLAASAQDVIKIGSSETNVGASGVFDRIEMERTITAGTPTAIVFPARLDGYYFGPDAKRMLISTMIQDTDGTYIISATPMADADDFVPGEKYLITPDIDVKEIVHLFPGVKTPVMPDMLGTELICTDITGYKEATPTEIERLYEQSASDKDVYFDVLGRRTASPSAGVYIHMGKKVVIK